MTVMQLSVLQRILSFLYPVKIRSASSEVNPLLELFFYRGQWQLATKDAIYSDGDRYRPLTYAFQKIKSRLATIKHVLVLGTGLGSAVMILDKMGYQPEVELIETDATIITWAQELLPHDLLPSLRFIHKPAENYIETNKKTFDLIIADVFEGRLVPGFVIETNFLIGCRQSLSEKGIFVLNYIITEKENWERLLKNFRETFPNHNVYNLGVNRILIATV